MLNFIWILCVNLSVFHFINPDLIKQNCLAGVNWAQNTIYLFKLNTLQTDLKFHCLKAQLSVRTDKT